MPSDFPASKPSRPHWRTFSGLLVGTAVGLVLAAYAFILAFDPYGVLVSWRGAPSPIMGLNQRYMYPQLIRSHRFDAAVIGTSTARLLDPAALDSLFDSRFANLAMDAATPWEQMQVAALFLRETPAPKALILSLDRNWCDADADLKRVTPRGFPEWLYADEGWRAASKLLNLGTLRLALRVAEHRFTARRELIRGDGYGVFVPPDEQYDLSRARSHIWEGLPDGIHAIEPPILPSEAERTAWQFPALPWLDRLLGEVPRRTHILVVFPPIHVAAQAAPGSLEAARDAECKRRVVEIGARHGATVADFRISSPITADDRNYWDKLHYRLSVAARFATALGAIASGTGNDAAGFYRVLTRTAGEPI